MSGEREKFMTAMGSRIRVVLGVTEQGFEEKVGISLQSFLDTLLVELIILSESDQPDEASK